MQTHEAQLEVRAVYLGGFPGQLVSGLVWLAATAAGTWLSTGQASSRAGYPKPHLQHRR
ncbi:MAG TPA: hypothetical protein VF883_08180 [Thermoanaerobaculia bacterium]|jgi:hypothetical protein